MKQLEALVEEQVRRHLNVSSEEFEYLRHPSPNHLHDPFYYKDMRELVAYLHRFKKKQEADSKLLLVTGSDYDTDGICANAILTAALAVFGFRFRVHIPSMEDGYGLTKKAVDKILVMHQTDGYKVGLILTADNGITSFNGISYAIEKGIDVLVTDHHPEKEKLPGAIAIVDPNQNGDFYPFKGNSGGCVAWKAMLAYASMFQQDKLPLIQRLIVFAGLSNVSDIMPLRGENRYTVTAALAIIKDILSKKSYKEIADTPYKEYNTVFHGLYDLITELQKAKDAKRQKDGKKPIPLPLNEELFGWYLSPLLNAPRRVHDTCLEGLSVFLVSDIRTRLYIIEKLIKLNEEKSKLRDRVLEELEPGLSYPVLCVNTRKGVSGLIAGRLAENSRMPSIVFSVYNPNDSRIIYETAPDVERLTGSARSNANCPLDKVIEKMNHHHPGLIFGGGHTEAAGFSIPADRYEDFKATLGPVMLEVIEDVLAESDIVTIPENTITLQVTNEKKLTAQYQKVSETGDISYCEEELNRDTFAAGAKKTVGFLESLRPFGKDFEAETKFRLVFDNTVYGLNWNPDFWKTFKFDLFGVEVLTFDTEWADIVKETLQKGEKVVGVGKLRLNEFRGRVTPQLVLEKEQGDILCLQRKP